MSVARRARRHWALPAICALFLLAGALAVDDYGIAPDEANQRATGHANLDYLLGDGERAFDQLFQGHDRYYGTVAEAPLAFVERLLDLNDSRSIYLSRHLLTHLFFLLGGVFCYLLAYRLFGSRPLALIAMVLFLLHPRIYAHSFFNSKDAPFLAMFMVALYCTHRAFRRDTLAAFLLCGAVVGLLVNLRIMGLVLFAAVLALRALDLACASSRGERKRVLLSGGAFALAAVLTFHATLPGLWTNPVGQFAEMLRLFSSAHPNPGYVLFQGGWLWGSDGIPLPYVPVWAGITTPPATLLLATLGAVALAWRGLRRPRDVLRNGPTRFGLLLAALPVATVAAAVLLENPAQQGWRYLYFLYAPMLLLAIFGLHRLASSSGGRWPRGGAYALAGAGVAVALVSMVRIHPYEDSYFNALTDRTTPERLASRYDLDYWVQSYRNLVGTMLDDHPSGTLVLRGLPRGVREMLPADDRERIVSTAEFRSGDANRYRLPRFFHACPHGAPGTHAVRVYGATVECVVDPVAYFGELRREALAMEPLVRSRFDIHRTGDFMVYLRDGCSREDMEARFFLRVYPADAADLPDRLRQFPGHRAAYGFEKRDFAFRELGTRIDGDCVAVALLPDYPIARIETGQYTPDWAEAARRAVAGSEPLARARFDVHHDPERRTLTYVREGCSAEDASARFFLHVHPADEGSLPNHRRAHGFDNLNFSLREQGARTEDGACVAVAPLPVWPIAAIRTGQFDETGRLWETEFALPDGR